MAPLKAPHESPHELLTELQRNKDTTGVAALFVFSTGGPKQNVKSHKTPVSDNIFYALSHHSLSFALHGSPINRHFKDSYRLYEEF